MKELFKIERLRMKMPPHLRPTQHTMNCFFAGSKTLNKKQIERLISIVQNGSDNAVSFLNKELEKLNNNGTTTSGR